MPNVTIVYSKDFGNIQHLEKAHASIRKIVAWALNYPDEQVRPDSVDVRMIQCDQPVISLDPEDDYIISRCSITITALKTASRSEHRKEIWEYIATNIREIPSLRDNGHFAGGSGHNRAAQTLLRLILHEGHEGVIPLFFVED